MRLFFILYSLWVVSVAMFSISSGMLGPSPILVLLCCWGPWAPRKKEISTLLPPGRARDPSSFPMWSQTGLYQWTSRLTQDRNDAPWITYFCVFRSGNAQFCSLSWFGHKRLHYHFVFPIIGSQHSWCSHLSSSWFPCIVSSTFICEEI